MNPVVGPDHQPLAVGDQVSVEALGGADRAGPLLGDAHGGAGLVDLLKHLLAGFQRQRVDVPEPAGGLDVGQGSGQFRPGDLAVEAHRRRDLFPIRQHLLDHLIDRVGAAVKQGGGGRGGDGLRHYLVADGRRAEVIVGDQAAGDRSESIHRAGGNPVSHRAGVLFPDPDPAGGLLVVLVLQEGRGVADRVVEGEGPAGGRLPSHQEPALDRPVPVLGEGLGPGTKDVEGQGRGADAGQAVSPGSGQGDRLFNLGFGQVLVRRAGGWIHVLLLGLVDLRGNPQAQPHIRQVLFPLPALGVFGLQEQAAFLAQAGDVSADGEGVGQGGRWQFPRTSRGAGQGPVEGDRVEIAEPIGRLGEVGGQVPKGTAGNRQRPGPRDVESVLSTKGAGFVEVHLEGGLRERVVGLQPAEIAGPAHHVRGARDRILAVGKHLAVHRLHQHPGRVEDPVHFMVHPVRVREAAALRQIGPLKVHGRWRGLEQAGVLPVHEDLFRGGPGEPVDRLRPVPDLVQVEGERLLGGHAAADDLPAFQEVVQVGSDHRLPVLQRVLDRVGDRPGEIEEELAVAAHRVFRLRQGHAVSEVGQPLLGRQGKIGDLPEQADVDLRPAGEMLGVRVEEPVLDFV